MRLIFLMPFKQPFLTNTMIYLKVKIGAITPVSEPTEWVSQMVAARKKDGSIRICIDPQDLNKALRRSHRPMRSVEDVASRMANATVFSTLDTRSGF